MRIPAHPRIVRLALALLLAAGVSASLFATPQVGSCSADCGGGCVIAVFNCPSCEQNSAACEIYWDNPVCGEWFFCTPGCPDCHYLN